MHNKLLGGAALLLLAANVQAASDYPSGYTKCVQNTGATCSMSGTHTVALGKSGSFVYATKTGSFACTGSAFPSNSFTTSAWCSVGPVVTASSSSSAASSSSVSSSSAASSSVASSSSSAAASASIALSAVAATGGITLNWSPSNLTTGTQEVYRDLDSNVSGRVRIASLASSVRTYTDSTAVAGTTYYYWIKNTTSGVVTNSNAASAVIAVASSSSSAASSSVAASSSSSAASSSVASSSSSASSVAGGINAQSLTGASTPFISAPYGVRNYSAPVKDSNGHDPANYKAAPALPTWNFQTVDPTGGVLSFERATAPQDGWHTYSRKGKVVVTGGSAAASNRVYTVFNGQQLVAAINEAKNEPKIIRVVGHIDLRWSNNNTTFKEYTSYSDQKFGGSIMLPSNTTLVGINDKNGKAARITGTTILIGNELALAAGGDPQTDFKAWIAAGKDGDDYPTWTRNIIIRNLSIDAPWDVNPEDSANAYADGMTISRAQNIYIDHVSMSDGDTPDSMASDTRHDGLLDIVRGSDYVTVTNSYFYRHGKTTLIGNGDSGRAWSDEGRLHVTLSNNFWDRVVSRLPLNRYGQVHMFNNYIYGLTDSSVAADLKFGSGVDPRYKSNMLLENMYFEITALATDSFCKKAIDGGNGTNPIGFRSSGHLLLSNKGGNTTPISWDGQCGYAVPTGSNVWTPPYAYSLVSAAAAKSNVLANAGAGKLK